MINLIVGSKEGTRRRLRMAQNRNGAAAGGGTTLTLYKHQQAFTLVSKVRNRDSHPTGAIDTQSSRIYQRGARQIAVPHLSAGQSSRSGVFQIDTHRPCPPAVCRSNKVGYLKVETCKHLRSRPDFIAGIQSCHTVMSMITRQRKGFCRGPVAHSGHNDPFHGTLSARIEVGIGTMSCGGIVGIRIQLGIYTCPCGVASLRNIECTYTHGATCCGRTATYRCGAISLLSAVELTPFILNQNHQV